MADEYFISEKDLSLFREVVSSFHTIRDMDEILGVIFEKIKPIFNIEGASIALHDPSKKEFFFIRTVEDGLRVNFSDDAVLKFPEDRGIAGWVRKSGKSICINDVTTDKRFFSGFDAQEQFVTRSMICVPLRTRKGFIGVLYALNKIGGDFTERDRALFEILSETIAISLENARLYGDLKDHLHTLEREKRLLLSQVRARSGFDQIIGSSLPMRRMFELMDKVIDTSTTVLIQGETGTGKELIAKVIHYNGPYKDKPFVVENCGAMPENLLESEMFGHVKGAFTGAIADKKGLFEIANGGTVFLDEIGEMSLPMQVKLLRVLQEGQFRPVGSQKTRQVSFRLIASTNRDLAVETAKGNFREDLYYRINVFQITPPPLRQRKEDIMFLANHFLEKFARKNNKPSPRLAPEAINLMIDFDWPGNVRELENEMERAFAMAAGKATISSEFLSEKLKKPIYSHLAPRTSGTSGTLKEVIRQMEKRMIAETLNSTLGNKVKAAKMLGLSRQGLLNKISAYNIAPESNHREYE